MLIRVDCVNFHHVIRIGLLGMLQKGVTSRQGPHLGRRQNDYELKKSQNVDVADTCKIKCKKERCQVMQKLQVRGRKHRQCTFKADRPGLKTHVHGRAYIQHCTNKHSQSFETFLNQASVNM